MKRNLLAALVVAVGLLAGQAFAEEGSLGSVSYDAEKKVLTVVFEKGGTYEYADVSQEVADEVLKAESKGEAFNKAVKGKFTAKKISE